MHHSGVTGPRKTTAPEFASFAKRLKAARLVAGLSQKKLAPLAGCSRTLIVTIEQGKTKEVSSTLIFALADALHVSPRWLSTGVGTQAGTKGLTEEEKHLILVYRALPATFRDHLVHTAQSLADASAETPSRVSPLTKAPPPPKPISSR